MTSPTLQYPFLTRAAVRAVDRISTERFGIPSILLMENAGRALLDAAWRMLANTPERVAIICGGGNNGGDGLALARHLHNRGCDVRLLCTKPADELEGDAAIQARIAVRMGLKFLPASPDAIRKAQASLIVDSFLGTGLTTAPRTGTAELIAAINECRGHVASILAVDLPSGLDCDTGRPLGRQCVRADVTVTFIAEKFGFPHAAEWLGKVVVGDIGCPAEAVWQAVSEEM